MKKNDLVNFNVTELSLMESKSIDGGWTIFGLIFAYVLLEWALNPKSTADHMIKGFEEGSKL
jgi:hypothetical protein